jgi:hypothetical protein
MRRHSESVRPCWGAGARGEVAHGAVQGRGGGGDRGFLARNGHGGRDQVAPRPLIHSTRDRSERRHRAARCRSGRSREDRPKNVARSAGPLPVGRRRTSSMVPEAAPTFGWRVAVNGVGLPAVFADGRVPLPVAFLASATGGNAYLAFIYLGFDVATLGLERGLAAVAGLAG